MKLELEKLTVAQLKKLAQDAGVAPVYPSKAKKKDWVKLLKTEGGYGLGSQLWEAKKATF